MAIERGDDPDAMDPGDDGARVREVARTDVGLNRQINEDRFLVRSPLFAVCDGLGGHSAGEVAAQLAVDSLAERIGPGAGVAELAEALQLINTRIADIAAENPETRGMSTTCVAVIVDGSRLHLAHVGDSRAYRLRGTSLTRLTEDHTVVAELVRRGALDEAAVDQDDRRHVLTQALGAVDTVEVTTATLDLLAGDRILLCSDGLSGQVPDADIASVLLAHPDPGAAADDLVMRSNAAGGVDNVTVVLVDPDVLVNADVMRRDAADTQPLVVPPAVPERPSRLLPIVAAVIGIIAVLVALAVLAAVFTAPASPSAGTGAQPSGATSGASPVPAPTEPTEGVPTPAEVTIPPDASEGPVEESPGGPDLPPPTDEQ